MSKRKHDETHDHVNAGPSPKKPKKEKKHKKHKTALPSSSEFTLIQSELVVSIPPVFASNPEQGVEEMLDSMVMRYIPALRGVVLTHSNLRFLQHTATIQGDCPYAICKVAFDAMVWSPRVGQRLTGQINLSSPDHISLLLHRTFNVSIPRHYIPQEEWVFEYGPAENDPEFGAGMVALNGAHEVGEDIEVTDENVGDKDVEIKDHESGENVEPEKEESLGQWVNAHTNEPLRGNLMFTVVGLTIANQMLSLIGSIQPDPFFPEHIVPSKPQSQSHKPQTSSSKRARTSESEAEAELELDKDSEPELDMSIELGKIPDNNAGKDKDKGKGKVEAKKKSKKDGVKESKPKSKMKKDKSEPKESPTKSKSDKDTTKLVKEDVTKPEQLKTITDAGEKRPKKKKKKEILD